MNKKGFFTITVVFTSIVILILVWTYYYLQKNNNITSSTKTKQNNNSEINSWNIKNNNESKNTISKNIAKEVKIEKAKEKIDDLRKKLELKWLILKWDIHLQNKEYTVALTKYLQIYKDLPIDEGIINKIGDTYYYLKKYNLAYKYYRKIKNYKHLDKRKLINSIIFSTQLTKDNIATIVSELKYLNLNEEDIFYYTNSIVCIDDLNLCKENFENHFSNKNYLNKTIEENNEIITWKHNNEMISSDLKNINLALENYKNFNIDDPLFENALISWAFFENWLYPIAINISQKILWKKPDYKPVLKIISKSYFEIWDYLEAKNYLMKYHNLWDEDAEISFFLGIVYEKMHEYILSSMHLQKAISLWYKWSLNAKKRLIYNYYELWKIEDMLNTFKDIIEENKDSISSEDLSLAIFYNILNNKIEDAEIFTRLAIKKFPKDEIFYTYMWWIKLHENWINSINEAEKNLKKWYEINKKNPMLNLISWKLEERKWNNELAISFYQKTISLDKKWEFWKIAEQDLKKLNKKIWTLKKIN